LGGGGWREAPTGEMVRVFRRVPAVLGVRRCACSGSRPWAPRWGSCTGPHGLPWGFVQGSSGVFGTVEIGSGGFLSRVQGARGAVRCAEPRRVWRARGRVQGVSVQGPGGFGGARGRGSGSSPVQGSEGFVQGSGGSSRGSRRGLKLRHRVADPGVQGVFEGLEEPEVLGGRGRFYEKGEHRKGVSDIFGHFRRVFVAGGRAPGTRGLCVGGIAKVRGLCGGWSPRGPGFAQRRGA